MGDNNGQNPRDPRESILWFTVGSQAGASMSSPAGGPGPGRFKQFAPQGTTTTTATVSAGDGFWDRFWNRLRDRLPHEATKAGVRVIVGPGLGILTDYFLDRYEKNANYVAEACRRALAKYVGAAIQEETGQAIEELIQGILQSLIMMMAVVATTTLIGAGAGAAVGFFCFGVGAAPGAAAGAELGFDAGLWILEWLGIGFLAVYIAKNLTQVVKVLGVGVVRAWNAGEHGASVDQDLDAAAKNIAKAIGILFRLILEAVVMYLLQEGIGAVRARVPGLVKSLSESKLGRGFGEWIGKNYDRLINDPKVNPKLRESSGAGAGAAEGELGTKPRPTEEKPPVEAAPGKWPTSRAQELLKKLDELNEPPKTKEKAHQKRLLSEQLGNEAAKSFLRKKLGKDIPDEDFQTFSGAHTVNVMYKDPATGKVYVMEAKGGSSELGTRIGKYPPNEGVELEQGSAKYLEDVAKTMENNPNDPAKRAAGRDILNAQRDGNLEYIGVRGAYDSSSPSANPIEPEQIFP
jgi:hypothetical protein